MISETDRIIFNNNFKVIKTNVSSLNEAKVIAVAERHDSSLDLIKVSWILRKLLEKGDTFYPEMIDFKNCRNYCKFLIAKEIDVKGWDSLKGRVNVGNYSLKMDRFMTQMEFILSSSSMNDDEIKQAIQQMSQFIFENFDKKYLEKATTQHLPFSDDEAKSILKIPCFLEKITENIQLTKHKMGEELKVVFLQTALIVLNTMMLIDNLIVRFENYRRNLSLAMHILEASKGKQVFVSGKNHLRKNKNPFLWQKESLEKIQEALEKKKYIIITPNKNIKNIKDMIGDISNTSRVKKIWDWVLPFFFPLNIINLAYTYFLSLYPLSNRPLLSQAALWNWKDGAALSAKINKICWLLSEKINMLPDDIIKSSILPWKRDW